MRTPKEIVNYIKTNSAFALLPKTEKEAEALLLNGEKHIIWLLAHLSDGENVKFAMLTNEVYKGESRQCISMLGTGVLFITEKKRLIYGCVGISPAHNVSKSIDLTDICIVSLSVKDLRLPLEPRPSMNDHIKIETRQKKCVIGVRKESTKRILNMINGVMRLRNAHFHLVCNK